MTASSQAKVAIIGRPNVGKSSLFNRLVGHRQALVHNEPGVTRDRLYGQVEWSGVNFEAVDTGGMEPGDQATIRRHIHRQIDRAVAEALAIVLVVDGREGLNGLDLDVAAYLRKKGRRILLAVNKIDNQTQQGAAFEFARLGLGEPIWISALHGLNVDTLLDGVVSELLRGPAPPKPDQPPDRIAIVGRPNVGKSSLINRLIDDERVLVDDQPGTTRDPVPVPFATRRTNLMLVDTAGMRRTAKIDSPVEKLSVVLAHRALEQSDIAVLVMDASAGVQAQDQRVAGMIQKSSRPVVLAVNKWDLLREQPEALRRWEDDIAASLQFLGFAPRVYISALEGDGLDNLVGAIEKVVANCKTHLTTGRLNSLLREAAMVHPPPTRKGKQLRIRYVSQLKNRPATFVFKVNDRTLVHFSYKRHLENVLRDAVDFTGVPLTLLFKDAGS